LTQGLITTVGGGYVQKAHQLNIQGIRKSNDYFWGMKRRQTFLFLKLL